MRIVILQLSDMHIRDARNEMLGRAEKIVSALRSCAPLPDIALLLYTGDIAHSGKKEQYDLAAAFCAALKDLLNRDGVTTAEFFVPGNHDVDIGTSPDELRDMANARAKEDVASISPMGTLAGKLLDQQGAFFDFVEAREKTSLDTERKLFRRERITLPSVTVDLHLFNTAFSSTLNEKPGTLVFPDHIIPPDITSDADLVLSILHHPLHWFEPSNARRFKRFVESGCDMVFTGHEHLPDAFAKLKAEDDQNFYVEGGALHDPGVPSAFNVVEVDLQRKTVAIYTCSWDGSFYVPKPPREFPLSRSIRSSGSNFRTDPEYAKWLDDPGTLYTHPHKKELHLSDFFVPPALRKASSDPASAFVDSSDSIRFSRESPRVAVLGEEGSGKTALAKALYRHYLSDSTTVPLMLSGEEFESVGEKSLRSLVRKKYVSQYGASRQERYLQLSTSEKALIIDNWHKVRFNERGRSRLMRQLKSMFGSIVCFASDLLSLERVSPTGENEGTFGDFEHCSLPEFGVRLRGRLIEKWHVIGQELTLREDELAYFVRQSENRINSILEKNFLPSFPFVVLTLLQADGMQAGNANLGSYGHLYELLITRRLGESSDKLTDLGTKYTYISRLAYHMYLADKSQISLAEMKDVNESYCTEYGQTVDLNKMLRELEEAQIISRDADAIRFKYRACYCYVVAKYFQENLANDEVRLREQLLKVADRVYFEDYSNIIIFFVFLTKDAQIIRHVVENANQIYAELPTCNFTTDVDFVNALLKETPKKLMEAANARENRDGFRRDQDEEDQTKPERGTKSVGSKISYAKELTDVQKVSMAFTNLRILGHILRNFTGVLRKDPKKQLAHASYSLALRVMKRIVDIIVGNMETFRLQLAEVVKQKQAVKARDEYDLVSDNELKRRADEALISLTRAVGFAIVKRLSTNLGSEDLAITYDEVKKGWGKDDAAVGLIDIAIKLDHFRDAPKTEIQELASVFRKNPYSFTLLQDLVAEYLYLNVSDQIA